VKKIFTLLAGTLMAVAVMAADHRPVVRLQNFRNFKVVIDGRSYFGNNMAIRLNNYHGNRHTIKVYEMRRGFFQRERLVDMAAFRTRNKDVMIRIDQFGRIDIRERRNNGRYNDDYRDYGRRDGRGFDDGDWNDRDGISIRINVQDRDFREFDKDGRDLREWQNRHEEIKERQDGNRF
jgi:hypothetical protein